MVDDLFKVREIQAKDTYLLREKVLGWMEHYDCLSLPEDAAPTTHHLGCFSRQSQSNEPIGVLTVLYHQIDVSDKRIDDDLVSGCAWQIRGMAVDDAYRGQHVGSRLIAALVDMKELRHGSCRLWANVRIAAVEFYRKNGFAVVGDSFLVKSVGDHYLMVQSER